MMLKHPWLLLLLLIYIPIIIFYIRGRKNADAHIVVSTLAPFTGHSGSWRIKLMHICFALKLLAIGCVIVALCRPQKYDSSVNSEMEGTDIVVAMDVSASMQMNDLSPNRFEASRRIASDFVEKRNHDNIGVVAFAGESLTYMPLTTDRSAVMNTIRMLNLGALGNGTAIGDGLVSAINRVLGGKAVSKSVILLTDGSNNAGEIDPQTAAQIAKQKGVKVYTIGIGNNEYQGFDSNVPMELDEESLQQIASTTGGKYFRAVDTQTLKAIFEEIDKLEKSKIDVDNFTRTEDNFMPWIGVALLLLLIEMVLRYTLLRRIP